MSWVCWTQLYSILFLRKLILTPLVDRPYWVIWWIRRIHDNALWPLIFFSEGGLSLFLQVSVRINKFICFLRKSEKGSYSSFHFLWLLRIFPIYHPFDWYPPLLDATYMFFQVLLLPAIDMACTAYRWFRGRRGIINGYTGINLEDRTYRANVYNF